MPPSRVSSIGDCGPHLPYPSSPQGRGGDKKEALFGSFSPLSRGERGAGGVRAAGAATLKERQRWHRRSTAQQRPDDSGEERSVKKDGERDDQPEQGPRAPEPGVAPHGVARALQPRLGQPE